MSGNDKPKDSPFFEEFYEVIGDGENALILHNDDENTFEYVIECLIEVCEHTTVQAEQCTYLVHYKGKCDVRKGSVESLKSRREALIDRGLNATID
jgi:ATP-dependent Clp protease adaptor protein ClpS